MSIALSKILAFLRTERLENATIAKKAALGFDAAAVIILILFIIGPDYAGLPIIHRRRSRLHA